MKSPLWILNSILIVLVIGMLGFIIWSWNRFEQSPSQTSSKTTRRTEQPRRYSIKQQDLQYIYKSNDLFRTSVSEQVTPAPVVQLPPIPTPPSAKPVAEAPSPAVQFLEPLPIKLTGITAHSIESKSHATIVNINTKQTKSYRVGDKLFDAYLIRIFPRKVILIRSNGQQESVYLYPDDAKEEIEILKQVTWDNVIQRTSPTTYTIDRNKFIEHITSLAKLIEMLDATTALAKGESIGIRIGKMNKNSIGYALGFEPNDIITSINQIAPTTTNNRIKIFNNLKESTDKKLNVNVEFIRNKRKYNYNYNINSNININSSNTKKEKKDDSAMPQNLPQQTSEEPLDSVQANLAKQPSDIHKKLNKDVLEQVSKQYAQSNTMKRLRRREHMAMRKFGKRSSVIRPQSG